MCGHAWHMTTLSRKLQTRLLHTRFAQYLCLCVYVCMFMCVHDVLAYDDAVKEVVDEIAAHKVCTELVFCACMCVCMYVFCVCTCCLGI